MADAQPVLAEDAAHLGLAVAPREQLLGDAGRVLELDLGHVGVVGVGAVQLGRGVGELLEGLQVIDVVQAEPDMCGADKAGDVVDVVHEAPRGGRR